MFDYDVHHGRVRAPVDWRSVPDADPEDDDELLAVTPAGVIATLGFDPIESRTHRFEPGHEPYNPDMGRDEKGRFTSGGGGGASLVRGGKLRDFRDMFADKDLDYVERATIYDYIGSGGVRSATINRELRGGRLGANTKEDVKVLDAAIAKTTLDPSELEDPTLYRGIDIAHLSEALGREPRPGDVIVDKAYQSTTTDRSWAVRTFGRTNFARDGSPIPPTGDEYTVLEIHPTEPIHAVYNKEEDEVIMPRGTAFRITGVETRDERVWPTIPETRRVTVVRCEVAR
jgi:hypothetical protein